MQSQSAFRCRLVTSDEAEIDGYRPKLLSTLAGEPNLLRLEPAEANGGQILHGKRVCVSTFTLKKDGKRLGRTVFPFQLIEYLTPRCAKLVCIEQPFSVSEDLVPTVEVYRRGKLVERHSFPMPAALAYRRREATRPSFGLRLRDLVSSLYFIGKVDLRSDAFIGIEAVNCLVGVFLRAIGLVDTVVYCVVDYMPRRFSNPLANGAFHALDRLSLRLADYAWNLSPRVEVARGLLGTRSRAVQLAVPLACPLPDRSLPPSDLAGKDVVYIGILYKKFGVEVLVRAFSRVMAQVPDAKLHIIGEGSSKDYIERYVGDHGLKTSIIVHGRLSDPEADKVIAGSRIGVAPYLILDSNSQFIYSDVGKVKLYLAYGLPVVITKQAVAAELVRERNAGLAVECTEEGISSALVRLLQDDTVYRAMRKNALETAADFTLERVFETPVRLAVERHGASNGNATAPAAAPVNR